MPQSASLTILSPSPPCGSAAPRQLHRIALATDVARSESAAGARAASGDSAAPRIARDESLRPRYAESALAHIPRLLGAIDRNPYRATYGCLDRQFWHYRTAAFASEMYQEGALALALVASRPYPGNRWHGCERTRELAVAALRFPARHGRRDGSADDYYPFERALGAAVFSLTAATAAYEVLELDDPLLRAWFVRRGRWLARHDESGRLANHQALAALGLARAGRITGDESLVRAAQQRLARVLAWQSPEGWFEEYGGADPGYQTLSIECLAGYQQLTGADWLDEPLRRAVDFARRFLHPDGSFAGEYGSRGTYLYFPHGMEQLAARWPAAADLADAYLAALGHAAVAALDDDRLIAHRLASLLEAYDHWSPQRPPQAIESAPRTCYLPAAQIYIHVEGPVESSVQPANGARHASATGARHTTAECGRHASAHEDAHSVPRQPAANRQRMTIISLARGGVFKHFDANHGDAKHGDASHVDTEHRVATDAGLLVELASGRLAVSQFHALDRQIDVDLAVRQSPAVPQSPATPQSAAVPPAARAALPSTSGAASSRSCDEAARRSVLTVSGPLLYAAPRTATPLAQAAFHLGMWAVGRWCRTAVRQVLQRWLIQPRRQAGIRLTRTFEFVSAACSAHEAPSAHAAGVDSARAIDRSASSVATLSRPAAGSGAAQLRVTDVIELIDPRVVVRRMALGTDHQMAYVAVSGIYHDHVCQPWVDLSGFVPALNRHRSVTIVRTF